MPYRKLANITDVALLNVKNVISGLREAEFSLQVNDTTLTLRKKRAAR